MISKIYQAQQKDPKTTSVVDEACQHEIMRIAELQTEDFHLDRPLYFACREDREVTKLFHFFIIFIYFTYYSIIQ